TTKLGGHNRCRSGEHLIDLLEYSETGAEEKRRRSPGNTRRAPSTDARYGPASSINRPTVHPGAPVGATQQVTTPPKGMIARKIWVDPCREVLDQRTVQCTVVNPNLIHASDVIRGDETNLDPVEGLIEDIGSVPSDASRTPA